MKTMLTKYAKPLGLAMMALGALGAWAAETNGLINVFRLIDPAQTYPDGSYPYPPSFGAINHLFAGGSLLLIAGGLLLFFFSGERDEYTKRIQLEALRFAALVQVGVVVGFVLYSELTTSLFNFREAVSTGSLLMFWATFVLRYYYVLYVHARTNVID